MPNLKHSNETFLVIFLHCVVHYFCSTFRRLAVELKTWRIIVFPECTFQKGLMDLPDGTTTSSSSQVTLTLELRFPSKSNRAEIMRGQENNPLL